ncbi:MAG TPA: outer membrane beta-barrel protein [Alphaproteobacteria bacterium]|nr:outer membrane beta-barrel protein [Alphaproteobacteria bacterium]
MVRFIPEAARGFRLPSLRVGRFPGGIALALPWAVAAIAILAAPGHATAQPAAQPYMPQDTVASQQVASRSRPEYDEVGIREGSIFFYPVITGSEEYNDNIYATQTGTKDDFISVVSPSLRMQSDWGRHELHGLLKSDLGFYDMHDTEDYQDYSGSIGGRYDISHASNFKSDAEYAHLHEDRSSPDNVNGKTPTTYTEVGDDSSLTRQFGQFTGAAQLHLDHLAYDSVTATSTSIPPSSGTITNSDRNRYDTSEGLQVGYLFMPDYTAFVSGALQQNTYEKDRDRYGYNRNAQGYTLDTGMTVDLTTVLSVTGHVGYLSVGYADSRLQTVNGLGAGLNGIWNVTRLTTVKADIARDTAPTTLQGAAAEYDTGGTVSVDHELLPNVILSARAGYTNSEFTGISRTDDDYLVGTSARYLIDNGVSLSAGFTHDERDTNASGAGYGRDVFLVSLSYGL